MSPELPLDKPSTVTGDLRGHIVESELAAGPRTIGVWLPPGYDADDVTRFPVLYMQDGQNLFDRATAFGDEWQVDETATELMRRGRVQRIIIVGIHNAGDARVDEYTSSIDAKHGRGGGLDAYGRMVVQDIKRFVDSSYRTMPSADSTGVGGSSLGGLAALHLALRYPTVFSRAAVLSPSVWWNDREIVKVVDAMSARLDMRVWLDAGTAEGADVIPDVRALRDALVRKGWRIGSDLAYHEVRGAGHDERSWSRRVGPMLRFLFPSRRRAIERTLHAWRRWRDRWTGPST